MSQQTPSPGGARQGAIAALLVVAVLALALLVTWAASVGPGEVVGGGGPPELASATPLDATASDPGEPDDDEAAPPASSDLGGPLPWLALLLQGLALLVAAGLVGVVVRAAWYAWQARPRASVRTEAVDAVDDDPLAARPRLQEALRAANGEQRALLLEGTPRNAVVACWHRFEQVAAEQGLARRPSETSSELVLRLLDAVDGEPGAATRLAGLYRWARFSSHPVTETHRAEALAALDQLDASLRRRSSSRPAHAP